jgi:hypothetical protein
LPFGETGVRTARGHDVKVGDLSGILFECGRGSALLDALTADVSTEGADRKFSVLGCFQRIPYISVSSSPIHIKTK